MTRDEVLAAEQLRREVGRLQGEVEELQQIAGDRLKDSDAYRRGFREGQEKMRGRAVEEARRHYPNGITERESPFLGEPPETFHPGREIAGYIERLKPEEP